MKNRHLSLIALAIIMLLGTRCDVGDPIEESQLYGKWQGLSITEDNKPGEWDPSKIRFEFKEDSTYTYRLAGDYKETGTWYIFDSKLYTSASNRDDISVEIGLPTPDSMEMRQVDKKGAHILWVLERQKE